MTDIQSIDWEVFVNSLWLPLSTCRTRGSLECVVSAKPPGIEVLNVENDALIIRRTSLRASFQDMKFKCTVRQRSRTAYLVGSVISIDLSVECKWSGCLYFLSKKQAYKHSDNHILYHKSMSMSGMTRLSRVSTLIVEFYPISSSGIWSHVDAVVNLTNHFRKILPRKTVDKVVLFDSSKANAIRIGVCRLHRGCQCALRKRVGQRSALADRLHETQCSILFSPVQDSDEGLGMRVKVHFTDSTERNLTLWIHLKHKGGK